LTHPHIAFHDLAPLKTWISPEVVGFRGTGDSADPLHEHDLHPASLGSLGSGRTVSAGPTGMLRMSGK